LLGKCIKAKRASQVTATDITKAIRLTTEC
jgi:hypothetical protein